MPHAALKEKTRCRARKRTMRLLVTRSVIEECKEVAFEQVAFMKALGMSNWQILEAIGEQPLSVPSNAYTAQRIALYWLRECWINDAKLNGGSHGEESQK